MAGIDWSLAQTDPVGEQARGFTYAQKIAQGAATQQAGQKFATGDYKGAVSDLASSGNIPGAMQVQQVQQQQTDRGVKSAEGVRDYVSKALPIFQHISEVHAGDPDGGTGAVLQAFDKISPELAQITGHDDNTIAQMRQMLATDHKGALDQLQAQIPSTYEKVGNTIVRRQGDSVKPVYTGTPTPPEGFNYQADGKTLAPIPGGPGDPTYKKQVKEDARQIIVNNPVPQQGGGESVALTPEGLTNQVDTYIASRGSIIPSFGYGKSGLANRDKFYNQLASSMKEQGLTANDIASGKAEYKANAASLTQVSKMRNQVESYEQTVQKNMDLLGGLVAKGAQNGAPVINRWIQAGRAGINGDPDVTAYNTAIQTVVNEYAKVMAGGTGSSAASSDSARAEAAQLLNNAQTPAQVKAAVQTMRKEMANRIESLRAQENDLKGRLGNSNGGGSTNLKAKYGLE